MIDIEADFEHYVQSLFLCASPEADGTDSVEYNKQVNSNDYMVSSVHRDASVGRSVTVNLPRVVDRIPLFLKSVSSRVICTRLIPRISAMYSCVISITSPELDG